MAERVIARLVRRYNEERLPSALSQLNFGSSGISVERGPDF
jgi:hypothetical protein